jgi:hypothetical protein
MAIVTCLIEPPAPWAEATAADERSWTLGHFDG